MWEAVLAGTAIGEIEFTLGARQGQAERQVQQQVWAQTIEISAGRGCKLAVTCLIAKEINPPAGCKALEWRLLTNRTVTDFDDAVMLINWYRCRWEIETLFHVLKNGCRVEALQLGSIAKLELALALYLAEFVLTVANVQLSH